MPLPGKQKDFRIDVVVDEADGAVGEEDVEPGRVGAAEALRILEAELVAQRRVKRRAANVVVEAVSRMVPVPGIR